jgi:heme O synthase-like polyprenyltransferase
MSSNPRSRRKSRGRAKIESNMPWLHLARISNLPTVWTNVTAAWLLAGGEGLRMHASTGSSLPVHLLYTGGMILNDAADVKFDREHRQERPIPSGQVSVNTAWSVGMMPCSYWGATLSIGFGANPRLAPPALVAAIRVLRPLSQAVGRLRHRDGRMPHASCI